MTVMLLNNNSCMRAVGLRPALWHPYATPASAKHLSLSPLNLSLLACHRRPAWLKQVSLGFLLRLLFLLLRFRPQERITHD